MQPNRATSCVLFFSFFFLFHVFESARLVGISRVREDINGQVNDVQRLIVNCDSETAGSPLVLSLQRTDSVLLDTVTITCPPPEIDYSVQLLEFIPEAVYVSSVPVAIVAPGTNYTSSDDIRAYVERQVDEQLSRAGINIDPLDATARTVLSDRGGNPTRGSKGSGVWSLNQAKHRKSQATTGNPFADAVLTTTRRLIRVLGEQGGVNPRRCGDGRRCLFDVSTTPPTPPPGYDPYAGFNSRLPPPPDTSGEITSIRQFMIRDALLNTFAGLTQGFAGMAVKGGSFGVGLLFALPSFIDAILSISGQSSVALLAKNIEIIAGKLLEVQLSMLAFQGAAFEFNQEVARQISRITNSISFLQQNDQYLQQSVDLLVNKTNNMQRDTDAIRGYVSSQFANVSSAFAILGSNTDNITRVILQLIERDDYQMNMVINAINQLRQLIDAAQDGTESLSRQLLDRRLATQFYHRALQQLDDFSSVIGEVSPFMNDVGRSPMSWAQRQSLRNVDGAIVMATVQLQGSYTVASSPGSTTRSAFAVGLNIDVICDPDFIANISLTNPNSGFMFSNIGPSTTAVPQCSGPFGSAILWNCNCIFRIAGQRIQYPQANPSIVFPWSFAESEGLLFDQTPGIYSGSIFAQNPVSIAPVYLNSMAETEAYLSSAEICHPTLSNSREWIQNRVRVVSQSNLRYVDVSLDSSIFPGGRREMCNGNHQEVLGLATSRNVTIAYAVYTFLRQEFSSLLAIRAAKLNDQLYGTIGQAKIVTQIGSAIPELVNAIRTHAIYFASLPTDEIGRVKQLPVFALDKEATRHSISVRINSGTTIVHSTDTEENSTAVPRADGVSGNVKIITNVALSTIVGESLLKPTMAWVGHSVDYTSNPAYFAASSDLDSDTDPTQPTLLVDFAETDIEFTGPRGDRLNYIRNSLAFFDRANLKEGIDLSQMVMNMSTFAMQNDLPFDPLLATNSANRKLRRIAPGTSFCGEAYNTQTQQLVNPPPDNFMCSLRRFFYAPLYWPLDAVRATFIPVEYSVQTTIDIPMGQLTQLVLSRCPASREIVYTNGTRVALIRLKSNEAISVRYSLCNTNEVKCLAYGTIASMSPGADFVRQFTSINENYYLQVWPLSDSKPTEINKCYSGPGVLVRISSNYTNSGSLPGNIISQVNAVVSPSLIAISSQQQVQTELSLILATLLFSSDTSSMTASILASLARIREAGVNLNSSLFADNQALLDIFTNTRISNDLIDQLIRNNSGGVTLNLAGLTTLIKDLTNGSLNMAYLLELQEFFLNNSLGAVLDFARLLDQFGDDFKLRLGLPDPGGILGTIGDAIGGVFSGLPDFVSIGSLIMIIVLIGAVICFGPTLLKRCRSGNVTVDPNMAPVVTELAVKIAVLQTKVAELEVTSKPIHIVKE